MWEKSSPLSSPSTLGSLISSRGQEGGGGGGMQVTLSLSPSSQSSSLGRWQLRASPGHCKANPRLDRRERLSAYGSLKKCLLHCIREIWVSNRLHEALTLQFVLNSRSFLIYLLCFFVVCQRKEEKKEKDLIKNMSSLSTFSLIYSIKSLQSAFLLSGCQNPVERNSKLVCWYSRLILIPCVWTYFCPGPSDWWRWSVPHTAWERQSGRH